MSVDVLLKLNSTGAPPDALRGLLRGAGTGDVLAAGAREWAAWSGLPEETASRLRERAFSFDAERELEGVRRLGASVIAEGDPGYPDLLRGVCDAPLLLYALGTPPGGEVPAVAFVGSRRPTPYGRRLSSKLAGAAAARGLAVVSGLARGIDTEAHKAALRSGGRTWAVLGSALDRLYPSENAGLAREIAQNGGCLLSEFPLGTPPVASNFPRRNRIVSGLCWGTVVVEGEDRSGSLITARLAGEQGRAVMAVPGPADSALSDAPNMLISRGAKLTRNLEDILEELPPGCVPEAEPLSDSSKETAQGAGAALGERGFANQKNKILELLRSDACSMEELARETGFDLPRLTSALIDLELRDLVVPVEGQRYAKK